MCNKSGLGLESPRDFSLAVVGLKLRSEHDDDCCVTIELASPSSDGGASGQVEGGEAARRAALREAWTTGVKKGVSKGAAPDAMRFGVIPRNFKGSVLTKDLAAAWKASGGNDSPL